MDNKGFSQKELEDVFKTLVSSLIGMDYANYITGDSGTAAMQAVQRMRGTQNADKLFIDRYVSEQTVDFLKVNCEQSGIEVVTGDYAAFQPTDKFFGAIVQYPNAEGSVEEYEPFAKSLHKKGIKLAVATDLTSLIMLQAPGKWGADLVFGAPNGCVTDKEQMAHIATTALHLGPDGLKKAASRIHGMTSYLNDALDVYGYGQENTSFFDTLKISLPQEVSIKHFREVAEDCFMDFQYYKDGHIGIKLDEKTDDETLSEIIEVLAAAADNFPTPVEEEEWEEICSLDESLLRQDSLPPVIPGLTRDPAENKRS